MAQSQHTSDRPGGRPLDLDGLLCALVLVPPSFSRNRFFGMFQDPTVNKVRRRAARVRGIIRQLLGQGRQKAELTGEAVLDDGQVLLRFRVVGMSYDRTAALTQLEAAALRYALHRAGAGALDDADKRLVEEALTRLGGVALGSGRS